MSVAVASVAAPAVAYGADSDGYVVKPGDSLVGIAGRIGVRLADLLAVNHLTVTSLIVPGQRLALPATTASGSSTVPGGPGHTVRAGDTLVGIAARYHVTLASLLAVNHLTVTSLIVPGQRLALPATTASGSSTVSGGPGYTVRAGDTLVGIAARYHVTLASLLAVNHLTVTSLIVPGQRLALPATTASGSSTVSGGPGYTVRAGDTLVGIAARYHVTLASLLAVNHLTVTSLIVPGQRLALPATTASGSSTVSGGPGYTVRAGDTLVGIAARYDVTLGSLLAVNHLTVTSLIVPGQRLTLPAGAVASSATTGSAIDSVLTYAVAQLGKPYRFFAAGPHAFDCSGLTLAAYAQIGVRLVHYSASQAQQGSAVDLTDEAIRPGDLVFMDTDHDGSINHVGIATDSTTWIQAARPGDVVRMGPMPPRSTIEAVRRFASNN